MRTRPRTRSIRALIAIFSILLTATAAFVFKPPTRISARLSLSQKSDESVTSSGTEALDRDEHVRILNQSLERHTGGRGIREYMMDSSSKQHDDENDDCWDDVHMSMRFALMSHGAKNDLDGPTNNYANFAALSAFQMTHSQLVGMPSCRMANPGLDQEEWSEVLQRVREMKKAGIRETYKGFRCTVDQTPFFIRDAIVWNCFDDDGEYYGQAVLFDREKVSYMDDLSPYQ